MINLQNLNHIDSMYNILCITKLPRLNRYKNFGKYMKVFLKHLLVKESIRGLGFRNKGPHILGGTANK